MNETKKKGLLKIAGIMLVIMLFALCIVSGTMAKYTSNGTTSGGTIDVAKWDIKVNGSTLENTISLSSLDWEIQPIKSGTVNNAVVAEKIAPGTWGYAGITVTNTGDVDALLKVSGTVAPTSGAESANLQFKVVAAKSAGETYADMKNEGEVSDLASVGVKLDKTSGSLTIYICYEWKYEAESSQEVTNQADTTMGSAGATLTLGTLTITAEQIQPEKDT